MISTEGSTAEQGEDGIERGNLISIEDENYQDWNALSNLGPDAKQGMPIPKRGEKDFEPDGTLYQDTLLEKSLNGMYRVLEFERGHNAKQKLISVWVHSEEKVLVPHAKGSFFKDIGTPVNYKNDIHGLCLTGLEAIYLMERGSLLIYEGNDDFELYIKGETSDFDYDKLSPLSLSYLYGLVASKDPRVSEKYQVYSYLKRHGYLVQEFKKLEPPASSNSQPAKSIYHPLITCTRSALSYFLSSWPMRFCRQIGLLSYPFNHSMHFHTKHYFNYRSVFQSLKLIPTTACPEEDKEPKTGASHQIHFNVWKPVPSFSKKAPPFPDFQVAVVNTRRDVFPRLHDTVSVLNSINFLSPFDTKEPKKVYVLPSKFKKNSAKIDKRMKKESELDESTRHLNHYLRLRDQKFKNGSSGKSVVYAVIDNGVISFMSLTEGDFALDNQYLNDLNDLYPQTNHGIIYKG